MLNTFLSIYNDNGLKKDTLCLPKNFKFGYFLIMHVVAYSIGIFFSAIKNYYNLL